MINHAIMFATKAHRGQVRKGTTIPYILHPLEAGVIVSQIKYDEDLICAAILHDVVEDAKIDPKQIEIEFNNHIAELVLSESEDKSKTWKERKAATLESLMKNQNMETGIIALADKLSNIRAIEKDKEELGEKIWERFNVKDKEEQGWYYKCLVRSLDFLSSFKAYYEFRDRVMKVFE